MKQVKYREIRQHQLGLVLIGACLVNSPERSKILSNLSVHCFDPASKARHCLQAIAAGDREGVYGFLTTLGVHMQDKQTAIQAVIERLDEMHGQQALEDTVRAVVFGDALDSACDLTSAEKRLSALLELIQAQKERKFVAQETFVEIES